LLIVGSRKAEIIIDKRFIQGRKKHDMTRVGNADDWGTIGQSDPSENFYRHFGTPLVIEEQKLHYHDEAARRW